MANTITGSLHGLVILDLTQMLSGPFCTQILADHGAEVIKIEPPSGDATRSYGPFREDDSLRAYGGYFQSVNRNKLGVVLDLKDSHDRRTFLELVQKADVVVENFREKVMQRLQLDYETLRTLNPRLVYASIRGFGDGRHGATAYQSWPAYDVVAQAMSGLMGITGLPGLPVKIGPGVGDVIPGIMAAFGIVSAILHAQKTGEGQYVDVSMTDTLLSVCERIIYQYSYQGVVATQEGLHHPMFAPFGLFRAADGFVALACPSDDFWRKFCRAMNRSEWIDEPSFRSVADRNSNRQKVNESVEAVTLCYSKQQLAERLGGVMPFGPVLNSEEIFSDPHFHAREMLCEVEHPGCSTPVTIAGVPMKMSRTPGGVVSRAPLLGEHTQDVLERFGIELSPANP